MNNDDGSGMGWEPSDPLCADPLCADPLCADPLCADPLCASRAPFTHNPQPATHNGRATHPQPTSLSRPALRATRHALRASLDHRQDRVHMHKDPRQWTVEPAKGTDGRCFNIINHEKPAGCLRYLSANSDCKARHLKLVEKDDGSGLQQWKFIKVGGNPSPPPPQPPQPAPQPFRRPPSIIVLEGYAQAYVTGYLTVKIADPGYCGASAAVVSYDIQYGTASSSVPARDTLKTVGVGLTLPSYGVNKIVGVMDLDRTVAACPDSLTPATRFARSPGGYRRVLRRVEDGAVRAHRGELRGGGQCGQCGQCPPRFCPLLRALRRFGFLDIQRSRSEPGVYQHSRSPTGRHLQNSHRPAGLGDRHWDRDVQLDCGRV